ncbi:MFS transporter [Kitasatospora sp. NPDC086801]|uniref:MFS transporter n=1 Tax=Kitasatospora sp. NPDC086801 TaxID=3364066 RepID=UPI0038013A9B
MDCSPRLTDEQFSSQGWRIPFLASLVLVAVGLFVRVSVPETPAFLAAADGDAVSKTPFMEVVRRQPRALALAAGVVIVGNVLYFVTQTFSLSYAATTLNVPLTTMPHAMLVSISVQAVTGFFSSDFSDRLGRRRLRIVGAILCAVWSVPLIWLLDTGRPALITVGFSVSMLACAVFSGPLSAYLAGVFETGYRFTAVALAFNAGVMVGGALAPIAVNRLIALTGSVWAEP